MIHITLNLERMNFTIIMYIYIYMFDYHIFIFTYVLYYLYIHLLITHFKVISSPLRNRLWLALCHFELTVTMSSDL